MGKINLVVNDWCELSLLHFDYYKKHSSTNLEREYFYKYLCYLQSFPKIFSYVQKKNINGMKLGCIWTDPFL